MAKKNSIMFKRKSGDLINPAGDTCMASLSHVYNKLDPLFSSYANVVQVKELHSKLSIACTKFELCCSQYSGIVDKERGIYQRMCEQLHEQAMKKKTYDTKVDQY